MQLQFQCSIVISIIFACVNISWSASLEEELTLTLRQQSKLTEFRNRVINKVPHDHMKQDIYLLRFLRARNFNVVRADQMLMDALKWRERNNMDNIHEEDWSDIEKEYRYFLQGSDKDGRPVQVVFSGEWDIRKAVVSGKRARIQRYFYKILDEPNVKIQQALAEGKNVTQFYLIYDLKGYNLVQQGCLPCTQILLAFTTAYESYYPGSIHRIVMVNTPSIFEVLLNAARPLMTKYTRDAMKIYGSNRDEWTNALKEDIPENKLLTDFGGKMERI